MPTMGAANRPAASSNGEILVTGEACGAMPFLADAYERAPRDFTPRLD